MKKQASKLWLAMSRWISKTPPIYAWHDDEWYNEFDGLMYRCDFDKAAWVEVKGYKTISFTPKTKLMQDKGLKNQESCNADKPTP